MSYKTLLAAAVIAGATVTGAQAQVTADGAALLAFAQHSPRFQLPCQRLL